MAALPTLNVVLEPDVRKRLEALAESTQRSESRLAAEAIAVYVERQAWIVSEIEQSIGEADAGDFASQEEVQAVLEKWKG